MRSLLALGLLLGGTLWADNLSGPSRSTIQPLPFGTLYYEPAKLGACQVETTSEGYRFTSALGEVAIKGNDVNGYRLLWGKELLTIQQSNGGGGYEIRSQDRSWILRFVNGEVTLTTTHPKDTVIFRRSGNAFVIKGAKGTVTGTTEWGNLRIQSPLGTTLITNQQGKRSFAGPALDQIPYLGRGLFIPFHGVSIFIDISQFFPLPELSEWTDWREILGP